MVEFRADFLEDKQGVYEEMVALSLDLGRPERVIVAEDGTIESLKVKTGEVVDAGDPVIEMRNLAKYTNRPNPADSDNGVTHMDVARMLLEKGANFFMRNGHDQNNSSQAERN